MTVQTKGAVLLRDAVEAARVGDKIVARSLLREILASEPDNEQAWLWRAAVAETVDESMSCLAEVLRVNPANRQALSKLAQQRLITTDAAPAQGSQRGAGAKAKPCPFCSQALDKGGKKCGRCAAVLQMTDLAAFTENRSVDEGLIRQAIQRLQSAVAVKPTGEDHAHLALAFLNLQSAADALPHLQSACTLSPWDQELRQVYEKLRNRKLVLAVDDSRTVQRIVALTLERRGYRVAVASDGMQALAKLDEELPDLILLDITMPRMDGYQVCRVIKDNKFTKRIPVLMLSGKDGFFDKVKGRLAGAAGYLTKPFEGDDLAAEVGKYLKSKDAKDTKE